MPGSEVASTRTHTMTLQRLTLWLAALMLLGTAACASSATHGDARIVVMPIAGSTFADGTITKVVGSRYELVSANNYVRTAKKLDAKSSDSRDVRRVLRRLRADAMVAGELHKRGKRSYELRLSLRAGDSGKEFENIRIKLKSKRLTERDRKKIKKKLYVALSTVDAWTREPRETRRNRVSSRSGKREQERAREIRGKKHDRERSREGKRLSKRDKKSSKKKSSKKERVAEVDRDRDRDREEKKNSKKSKKDKKSKSSKNSKKSKKKKSKKKIYEVKTVRDKTGQALDEESPF